MSISRDIEILMKKKQYLCHFDLSGIWLADHENKKIQKKMTLFIWNLKTLTLVENFANSTCTSSSDPTAIGKHVLI